MAEQKTIFKWFWIWNFEKEEQWLNEMAMNGWALCSVGFCNYTFEKCESGEYTIRLEMHEIDNDYIDFMKQTNADYIGRYLQWIYFRKKVSDGSFDIFSDRTSRLLYLDKIGKTLGIIGFINLFIGIINSFQPIPIGIMNLLCATLLMYALGRIHGKIESLKKICSFINKILKQN